MTYRLEIENPFSTAENETTIFIENASLAYATKGLLERLGYYVTIYNEGAIYNVDRAIEIVVQRVGPTKNKEIHL